MIISVGSTLFHNYGAMFPTFESVVKAITPCGRFAVVDDLDEEEMKVYIPEIKPMGTRSVNGSPIGVFLVESV